MVRKKANAQSQEEPNAGAPIETKDEVADCTSRLSKLEIRWIEYLGPGDLAAWQKLMRDLGFTQHFPSKTQCRKVLQSVWVNIVDFLNAVKTGAAVHHFKTEKELRRYTKKERKFFPKRLAKEPGNPLRGLLAHIRY